MLLSIFYITIFGFVFSKLFEKLNMPALIGYLIAGILIGPSFFNIIDLKLINISAELRKIALVVILIRAGLGLCFDDFKKMGKQALLLSFVPASFEILAIYIFAPIFLNISRVDALVLGSVIAAVSPAVIVPKMLEIKENNYGQRKKIPQLLLAGASVDDVYVIVLFTSFLTLAKTGQFKYINLMQIPVNILLGIFVAILLSKIVYLFLKSVENEALKTILLLSICLGLTGFESLFLEFTNNLFTFCSLLTVMVLAMFLNMKDFNLSNQLSKSFNGIWEFAQILLFVLVGISVNISYAFSNASTAILVLIFALILRMLGVYFSVLGSNLNLKERIFCMLSYTPKATVQAAIGAIPLSEGLSSGSIILTVAVLAILITAPLGAIVIENTYRNLLEKG